jgi:iron-sulfur cluster repair protein YtfE (RIC family)
MNAISLLKADHRKLERLFERHRGAAEAGKRKVLDLITAELTAHMVAEEKVLYPILRTGIEDGRDLVDEAVKEHDEAKALLAELARREPGSFDADAKVATLRQAVDHHVREEEGEIFPEMAKSFGVKRLNGIGTALARAKKSAPTRPATTRAAKSPGASILGLAEAARDRVTSIFQAKERKPARASTRRRARPMRKKPAKKR